MTAKSLEERLDSLLNEYDSREHVSALEADLYELATDQAAEIRRLRFIADGLEMANKSLRREVERLREATDVARAADKLRCAEEEIGRLRRAVRDHSEDARLTAEACDKLRLETYNLREELAEYKRFTYEFRDHCAELDDERRAMRSQLKEKTERSENADTLLHRCRAHGGYWAIDNDITSHFDRYEQKETT